MPKRKYEQVQQLLPKIRVMVAAGKTQREIAEHFGFSAIDRNEVRPRTKYQIVYMNRNRYPVSTMCRFFGVSRSGYYDYIKRMDQPAHDTALAAIIREQQDKCDKTYGYRRIWKWLKKAKKIHRNPKTILRIMKKYELLSEIRRRRKWRQMGQQLHK